MNKVILLSFFIILGYTLQAQKSDIPYDYPVKPASVKWQSFKSTSEMYAACQVPGDILAKLSTPALIKTCLTYPASAVFFIHNVPQQGFNEWKQHFNGIQELLKRTDAGEGLLEVYAAFDTKGHAALKTEAEKGDYTFTLLMLESIIAQEEITGSLDAKKQKSLLKTGFEKYRNMESDLVYGFSSKASTGRLISKAAFFLGGESLKARISMEDAQQFITTGALSDKQTLLDIVQEAAKINTNE
jgi:hypothetical protein